MVTATAMVMWMVPNHAGNGCSERNPKIPQKRSRMFGIFKSKYNLINSGLMKGMTDVHSHVLPGVDDGSPDINASLSLLRYMESIGLRKVWLTPYHGGLSHTEQEAATTARRVEGGLFRPVGSTAVFRIYDGCHFYKQAGWRSAAFRQQPPAGRDILHVPSSRFAGYPDENMECRLSTGHRPPGALPVHGRKDYLLLKEKGYSFQLNLMSLSGYYGPHPKVVSEKLLKQKCTILWVRTCTIWSVTGPCLTN